METKPKDYGTNNPDASKDGECPLFRKHIWVISGGYDPRGYNKFKCKCGATHVIDSSD